MKLNQLGTDFNSLDQEEQRVFFFQYSEKRAIDLAMPSIFKKAKKLGATRKKGKDIKVTSETLAILKGLKLI